VFAKTASKLSKEEASPRTPSRDVGMNHLASSNAASTASTDCKSRHLPLSLFPRKLTDLISRQRSFCAFRAACQRTSSSSLRRDNRWLLLIEGYNYSTMDAPSRPSEAGLVVGVDVGGTNTDAVLWSASSSSIMASAKVPSNINASRSSYGIEEAIEKLRLKEQDLLNQVQAVFLGTTAFVNALLEGRNLDRVAVLRLCGPSSRSLPPFCDFPPPLKEVVSAGAYLASGGLRFDGSEECHINTEELKIIASQIASSSPSAHHVVVSGTFSPSDPSQEERAAKLLRLMFAECHCSVTVSISSAISSQLGLLARENSAILNACLESTARRVAARMRAAVHKAGIPRTAQLFFTCNDGSVVILDKAAKSCLRCVQCGPTNSLRGAAHLILSSTTTVNKDRQDFDRIVLDVGGTSTDAGCLVGGIHPRDSNSEAYVAGIVRCNHHTTSVVSIGLGGGSIVTDVLDGKGNRIVQIGPKSVGSDIVTKARCFGGSILTASCIAVAMKGPKALSWSAAQDESQEAVPIIADFDVPLFVSQAWDVMQQRFYDLVEKARSDNSPVEVILVGGGSGLVDEERLSKALGKNCRVVRPPNASVANACGAAFAQNVGEAESIVDLSGSNAERDSILESLKSKARQLAGSHAEIIECTEIPLAYLPGKMTRVFVRAVAPLDHTKQPDESTKWTEDIEDGESSVLDKTVEPETSQPVSLHAQILQGSLLPSEKEIENGIWKISEYDAHCLAIGCGILGCGGGGSTFHGKLQLLRALKEKKPIRVISVDDLPKEAAVAPCGLMGAPTVGLETISGPEQLVTAIGHAFALASRDISHSQIFIGVSEIGGSNGIMPLLVGGMMDLPVVDVDLMGRAFPELQMTTASIYGLPQTPMTIGDEFGRCVTIHRPTAFIGLIPADDDYFEERVLRKVSIEFGCVASLVDPVLTRDEIRRVGVSGSLSRARRIGDCILRSRHPGEAVESMLDQEGGRCIFQGMVYDVCRTTSEGFAVGTLSINSEDKSCSMTIQFQNEFLMARREQPGKNPVVEGCVPDIISLLDADTARPIATEEVRFGFRVRVILLPISALLRSEEALRVVGPEAFGLDETYKSALYKE